MLGRASGVRAQPAPVPALSLDLSQQAAADGTRLVTIRYGSSLPAQLRLIENRAVLLLDSTTGTDMQTITVTYPADCGRRIEYVLYAIRNGVVAARRTAAVTLCADQATPTPAAAPAGAAAPVAAPTTAAPSAPASASAVGPAPGQPSVPAPPVEPPSLAMTDGFVLANADDFAAANAMAQGIPLVRVLAIWLRGTDSSGSGSGNYQYVLIANVGGAPQDLSDWTLQGGSGTLSGLNFFFPDGFSLDAGTSCRIYVDHPAEATCTNGSFALYQFWGNHGTAALWDGAGNEVDELDY